MHHAVHAADVNERAIGRQGLDGAGVLLADLDLGPDLLLGGLALFALHRTDGADHAAAAALAVDLGDPDANGLTLQLFQIAAAGDAGSGGGDKDAGALVVGNQAALVGLADLDLNGRLVVGCFLELVPDAHAVELLAAELNGALLVVHANDKDLDLIADVQNVLGLLVGVAADFIYRNVTGVLGTKVNLDFGGADGNDDARDRISCS